MIVGIVLYNLLKNKFVEMKAKRDIRKAVGGNK
jgi:hypothetical protein